MPDFTLTNASSAFTNPINLMALGYMVLMLVFWYSARFWQSSEMVFSRAKFLSPKVTQILQKRFRNPFLDWFTSVFWFWIFGTSIFIMWFICMFQGPEAWRYGIPVVTAVSTSMLIQVLYPVVVPIRYGDFGKDIPVDLIRFEVFESSDKVNGLLYNGLPSNHLGMVITGVWLALTVNSVDPWTGWYVLAIIFIIFAFVFAFTVLYLGEHYWQDLLAAAVVYLIMLTVTYYFLAFLFPL